MSSIISPYLVIYLLWVFGAFRQLPENNPSSPNHEQGYKILIVILPIIREILHSISTDIDLTIKGNLDVFLLREYVVTVMILPLNLFLCINLLQKLSVLAVTIFK